MDTRTRILILGGSVIIAAGAWAISSAEAPDSERAAWRKAIERECLRYGLKRDRVIALVEASEALENSLEQKASPRRSPWELAVLFAAVGIFVWLATLARAQPVAVNSFWIMVLIAIALAFLLGGGLLLWRRTRFS